MNEKDFELHLEIRNAISNTTEFIANIKDEKERKEAIEYCVKQLKELL